MGGAILAGLRDPAVAIARPIAVTTHSAASAAQFDGADDVAAVAVEQDAAANRGAVAGARACDPRGEALACRGGGAGNRVGTGTGRGCGERGRGRPSAAIEAVLPAGVAVVRAMPNTPAHLGRGMTGIAGGASADAAAVALVQRLFETVGLVLVVDEAQIDDVAAVSGSGPAYLFYYVEEMIGAAERRGFTPRRRTSARAADRARRRGAARVEWRGRRPAAAQRDKPEGHHRAGDFRAPGRRVGGALRPGTRRERASLRGARGELAGRGRRVCRVCRSAGSACWSLVCRSDSRSQTAQTVAIYLARPVFREELIGPDKLPPVWVRVRVRARAGAGADG